MGTTRFRGGKEGEDVLRDCLFTEIVRNDDTSAVLF